MHRRALAILFALILPLCGIFAQEADDEWFWDQPISKIDFEGLKNVKKSDLSGIVSNFVGLPFNDEVYNDILDRLYSMEMFDDIVPYAKHDSKNQSSVLLVFQVKERPVISSINFEGNKKIRNGELRDQIKIKATDVYVESKVLLDERTLRNYFLQKGYTNSSVSHTCKETENGVEVTFVINEGSSTVIKEISFTGLTIASPRALRGKLQLKESGFMKDGELYLTDRIKDLFKTSNGKYIAPQMLESKLVVDRYVDQIVIIADRRKFVSALIIPEYELLEEWARRRHIEFADRRELCSNPEVVEFVMDRIDTMQQDLAHYEQVKRITLLPEPFSMEKGELTNTLKVKRSALNENYRAEIDKMYE